MSVPKHVVGLSGGKDSCALALALRMARPDTEYEYLYNATGNELPEMEAHLAKMELLLGAKLKRVVYHTDLYGMIEEMQMLPNFRARFCTRILKIEPTIEYFATLPPGSILYVGLRADEEERQGLFGEDLIVSFPFREWGWGLPEVLTFLEMCAVTIPPRTDCGLCYHQRLGEWRNLYLLHPGIYAEGVDIERRHGHTFRSPGRDTWPVSLAELAKAFDSGRVLRERKPRKTICRVCSL
jgi:Phosphoadenosine phosphosulfate reductase family